MRPFMKSHHMVHSLVRGTDKRGKDMIFMYVGSFPRMRDRQRQVAYSELHRRFIPACAGQTNVAVLSSTANSVHSRMCGTGDADTDMSPVRAGSFLRVRDKPRS